MGFENYIDRVLQCTTQMSDTLKKCVEYEKRLNKMEKKLKAQNYINKRTRVFDYIFFLLILILWNRKTNVKINLQ